MRNAPPPVRSTPRSRSADPRVLVIGALFVVLVVIEIVLAAVLTRGSSKPAGLAVLPGAADAIAPYRGIRSIATSVPALDVQRLMADRSKQAAKAAAVNTSAQANDVNGTPTIFVGRTGSKPALVGTTGLVPTEGQVVAAIDAALR